MVTLAESAFELSNENMGWLIFLGFGSVVVVVWVAFKFTADVLKTRQIQQTKREIAAYVAEGSIQPEDAVRILSTDSSDLERQIGTAVAWGTISTKKAAELLKAAREGRGAGSESAASAGVAAKA